MITPEFLTKYRTVFIAVFIVSTLLGIGMYLYATLPTEITGKPAARPTYTLAPPATRSLIDHEEPWEASPASVDTKLSSAVLSTYVTSCAGITTTCITSFVSLFGILAPALVKIYEKKQDTEIEKLRLKQERKENGKQLDQDGDT